MEHRFHNVRKWRFDFAWPDNLVAVEVQGGIWLGESGAHTSAKGRARDCEKLNEAALLGWRVLEIVREHIRSGQALQWVEELLGKRETGDGT